MNSIQKPNDILIATLSAPQANVVDLLQNNINVDNTSILTPEEYKQTPFVQQRYTQNGVFNEDAFNQDYLRAYANYTELANAESYNNLSDYLTYAPQDRFAPMKSRKWDVSAEYEKIHNPLQRAYSVQGINTISAPTLTPEEAAQSNHIFDPETGKFINETPETLNIFKKAFGQTLVYAKWESDGSHINSQTGVAEFHKKGQWKTDENGNYYTEFLGDRELLDKQVVALGDIITDEGTLANRFDFFDSDGYDKSAFGTAMKAMLPIAFYLIPGVNSWYATLSVIGGLASVMPTFYKSFESIIGVDRNPLENDTVTAIENWFRKFETSKSYKGRDGFWTWENMAGLVADVWGQAHQQRAAAKAANWFLKAPKAPKALDGADISMDDVLKYQQEWQAFAKSKNTLETALSRGYMSLISTADMYNTALQSGYDRDVAGWAALLSAAGMYGIMHINETSMNLGTWMLDKTTGYNQEVSRGAVKKLVKDRMDDIAKSVKEMRRGYKQPLADTFVDFRKAIRSKAQDIFVIGSEDVWKNAIVEGVEEVTEEMVQDAIKGVIDAMNSVGIISQGDASFGGWQNVFSKEGLSRYLATFVGGGIGGGLFSVQRALDNKFSGTDSGKNVKYTLRQAILDGRLQEVAEEFEHHKKFYNQRQGVEMGEINGEKVYLTGDATKSQADVIYERAMAELRHEALVISRITSGLDYDPKMTRVYGALSDSYEKSGLRENYIKPQWDALVQEIASLSEELQSLNTQNEESEKTEENKNKIKKLQDKLSEAQKKLTDWNNGENFANFTLDSLIFLNKELSKRLMSLDVKTYAHNMYGVDYDKIENSSEKEKIDNEFSLYKFQVSRKDLFEALPKTRELLKKTMPSVTGYVKDIVQNNNNKLWLKNAELEKANQEAIDPSRPWSYQRVLEYLEKNPKYWSLSDRYTYDLASQLESNGIINIKESGYNDEEVKVIKQLINELAIFSHVNVWTTNNLRILMQRVNEILEQRPADNPYIVKLNDLKKDESKTEDGKETDQEESSMINVALVRIKTNFENSIPYSVQNIKLKSILDVISDTDEFIDDELYHLLETTFNKEIIEKQQQEISQLLTNPTIKALNLDGSKGDVSLSDILVNGLHKLILFTQVAGSPTESANIQFTTDLDFSNLTVQTAPEMLGPLKALKSQIEAYLAQFPTAQLNQAILTQNGTPVKQMSIVLYEGEISDPFGDFLSAIDELINLIENEGLAPKELQDKWNTIKTKSTKENPVLTMIKSLSHKFGVNNDSLLDWLWEKENKILNKHYELSDAEVEDIKNLKTTLNFAYCLLACMQAEGSDLTGEVDMESYEIPLKNIPLPFNGVMRNYYNLYNNGAGADLFPVFSYNDLKSVVDMLSNLEDKLRVLEHIHAEKFEQDSVAELNAKDEYIKNALKLINEESLTILHNNNPINIALLSVPEDEKETDPENKELYVVKNLQAFGDKVRKAIAEGQFTEEEFIHAVVKKFPTAFKASDSFVKSVEVGQNSDKLNFDMLIEAVAVDYGSLYQKLSEGLKDKVLDPRPGQEYTLKSLIAFCTNTEFYAKTNQILYDHFIQFGEAENKNSQSGDVYRIYQTPMNYISRVQGAGGTGKSTIMKILIDALKPKNVVITAPTSDKVSDLENSLDTFPKERIKGVTIDQLLPNKSTLGEDFKKAINKILNIKQEPGKNTHVIEVGEKEIEIEFTLDSAGQKIQGLQFTEKGLNAIKEFITDSDVDLYKDSLIILDENSNIDILTLALLNALAEKSPTTKVITLGDSAQIGTTFTVGDTDYIFNISSLFMHRTPALKGVLRAKNSGIHESLITLHDAAAQFVEEEKIVRYDESTDTADLIQRFRMNPMKYKDLMGVKVAESSEDSKATLEAIKDQLDADSKKSFIVIYEPKDPSKPNEKPEELVNKLQDIGIPSSRIKFKTLKDVQGAEADFVYVYGLTSTKGKEVVFKNGDTDMQKAYTAVSRGKEFVLIEDIDNGLFSAWGIHSVLDQSVDKFTVNNEQQLKDRMNVRRSEIEEILATVKPQVEGEQVDLSVKEDDDTQGNTTDDADVDKALKPDIQEHPEEPEKETEVPNITDEEQEAINKNPNIILKNAVKLYGYYTRLGITRYQLNQYLSTSSTESANQIMQQIFDASSPDEQARDFLAYWNAYHGSLTSPEDLIKSFLELRNKLLYGNGQVGDELFVSIKYKDDTDFAYLKPNDDVEKDTKNGGLLTTVLRKIVVEETNTPIYITIGRTGMNKADGSHSFSRQLAIWQRAYYRQSGVEKTGRSRQVVYKLKFKGAESQASVRQEFYDRKKAKAAHYTSLSNMFIYHTGLKIYEIDPQNPLNEDWLLDGNKLLGRTSKAKLEKMGYQVRIIDVNKQNFERIYNQYRFGEDIKVDFAYLAKYKWVLISPTGVEATPGNSRLLLLQDSKPGTIWSNLSGNKKLNAYFMKSIVSYLNYKWGNKGDFAGLSTQFCNGTVRNLKVINAWIKAIENWRDSFDPNTDKDKIDIINGLLDNFYYPQQNKQVYPKLNDSKSGFLTSLGLNTILDSPETEGWMYDYVSKDLQATSQARRVPEAPDMYLNFDEYEIVDPNTVRSFSQLDTISSMVGQVVDPTEYQTPAPGSELNLGSLIEESITETEETEEQIPEPEPSIKVVKQSQELEMTNVDGYYTGEVAIENGQVIKFGKVEQGDVIAIGTYNGQKIQITSPISGTMINYGYKGQPDGSKVYNFSIKPEESIFTTQQEIQPVTEEVQPTTESVQENTSSTEELPVDDRFSKLFNEDGSFNKDEFVSLIDQKISAQEIYNYINQYLQQAGISCKDFLTKINRIAFGSKQKAAKAFKRVVDSLKINCK